MNTALSVGLGVMGLVVTIMIAVLNAMSARVRAVEEKFERYVRRDDLNGHLATIDKSITEVKDDIKDLTKLVLAALAKN